MLRRIFGPTRGEIIGGWKKKLHDEEFHNLYLLQNIIQMIKSRRIRWSGHVARRGEEECVHCSGGKNRRKEITRRT
jgi:hypothetical protein